MTDSHYVHYQLKAGFIVHFTMTRSAHWLIFIVDMYEFLIV